MLTMPLIDRSSELKLYEIFNVPILHPQLNEAFTYYTDSRYFAIKNNQYATLAAEEEFSLMHKDLIIFCRL